MDAFSRNWKLIAIALVSFLLGGLILLSVSRIGQQAPVAPTAPTKQRAFEGTPVPACQVDLSVVVPSATPNSSPPVCVAPTKQIEVVAGACLQATVTLNVAGVCSVTMTQRLPLDVMVVFDRSGSMGDLGGSPLQPIADAKTATNQFIDSLNTTDDHVGLVSFSDTATVNSGLTANFTTVKNEVNALVPNGFTNIGDAIFKAQQELAAHGRVNASHIIVVMTDGVANRSHAGTNCAEFPSAADFCTNDVINQSAAAKAAGTTVFTIGFRINVLSGGYTATVRDVAVASLKSAASTVNDFFSADQSNLAQVFDTIAASINQTFTSTSTLTEVLPAGVHYIAGTAIPAPTTINGQTLTWDLGALNPTQTQQISFNVSFDSANPGQLVEVYPDSNISYPDPSGNMVTVPFPQVTVDPVCFPSPTPTLAASATPSPSSTPGATPFATPTVTPTATPTATPSATPTLQCVSVQIYRIVNNQWILVTDQSALKPGDTVIFAVKGSTNMSNPDIDMAQFRITAGGIVGQWQQTTLFNAQTGEFYIQYTLLPGVASYQIEAQVHSVTLGWQ